MNAAAAQRDKGGNMKTWLITPLLLCAAGLALAADKAPAPAPAHPPEAVKPEPAPDTQAAAPAMPAKSMHHKAGHLPRGDLRHCLELKDSKAIIRCSETGRKM
jgi:hypothetical protein